jgi:hypothetical protein
VTTTPPTQPINQDRRTPVHETAPQWSPARLAYGFYAVAASGAVIGQTWVALTHVTWSPAMPAWVRVAAVLPFALCLELLAMALAAMADERLRLGERAYAFRVFSVLVAAVAVGILVIGHWPHYYWSAAFGVLSSSAYLLWLLHSAARRRDALRAAGKLADTAPDYGLWRRLRYPIWTARAAELAREGRTDETTGLWRPLGLYESLRAAQLAIRAEKRRPALAKAVEHVVRADHRDLMMADIAVRTLDLDHIATQLETLVDYPAWANRLAPAITAPTPPRHDHNQATGTARTAGTQSTAGHTIPRRTRVVVRRSPSDPDRGIVSPNTQPPSAPNAPALPGRSGHTEQPRDSAPSAHTVPVVTALLAETPPSADPHRASPLPAPPGDHDHPPSNNGGADAASGDRAITDPGDADPVSVGVQTPPLSETAAAVAYWRGRHPELRPAEIAARVGKSTRQVRRILATLDRIEQPRHNGSPSPDRADAHR